LAQRGHHYDNASVDNSPAKTLVLTGSRLLGFSILTQDLFDFWPPEDEGRDCKLEVFESTTQPLDAWLGEATCRQSSFSNR
jgi:hypothetical protein